MYELKTRQLNKHIIFMIQVSKKLLSFSLKILKIQYVKKIRY